LPNVGNTIPAAFMTILIFTTMSPLLLEQLRKVYDTLINNYLIAVSPVPSWPNWLLPNE